MPNNTIESHYTTLKTERDRLAMGLLSIAPEASGWTHINWVRSRIAERATSLSMSRWAEIRQDYAARRADMPSGSVSFGLTGYTQGEVSSSRPVSPMERACVEDARAQVRAELAVELAAAERAFDRYAELVAQGVALAPSAE